MKDKETNKLLNKVEISQTGIFDEKCRGDNGNADKNPLPEDNLSQTEEKDSYHLQ